MAQAIATTPGAIGLTSMTYVQQSEGRMRALALDGVAPTAENVAAGRYALARRAMLVTKASPSRRVRSFLMFVRSGDGAHVIRANGASPLDVERR
jgi:phosphate transport system substrate-binding protein